ncbi:MAG TPA: c-type cytochrome [Candidatus Aquicultor sp.]|jgi:cytochrome c553
MAARKTNKKLISILVLVFTASLFIAQNASAVDTKQLVYKACTECHDAKKDPKTGKTYWEGQKKTKAEWSKIVNKMQMWGAQLTDQDTNDVNEYLTAMSKGTIKQPTTTTTQKPKPTTTTSNPNSGNIKAQKTAITTTTVMPTTTTTLPPATLAPVTSVPKQQAKTGIEVIWYLLGGGGLVGSGMAMRNKGNQLSDEE